jgi:hypothetical protein
MSIGGKCNDLHMTIIEIRPFRNGWQVYQAPGVQPVFLDPTASNLNEDYLQGVPTPNPTDRFAMIFADC